MEIKHILVIRFRRVGDSVLATALCRSLRQSFPQAQIDYVLNENIASLYENHPDIDRVIPFNDRENHHLPTYIRKVRYTMKATPYDIIIDMRTTVRTLLFSLFSLHTPFRIGNFKKYSWGLHNYRIKNKAGHLLGIVQQNQLLLKPLEKLTTLHYADEFTLYVDEGQCRKFREYMVRQGIDFNRPVILAAETSREAYKVWPLDRMEEILRRIINQFEAQIIFNYAGNEKDFAVALHRRMGMHPNIFTCIEAKSLTELCALTRNCDFFFGNEGGPRHISQALSVPSFAIFAPGNATSNWLPGDRSRYHGIGPEEIRPLQPGENLRDPERFKLITVERVWEELSPMLERYFHNKKRIEKSDVISSSGKISF